MSRNTRHESPGLRLLTVSWELALQADGYADGTVNAYQSAAKAPV
jgi:hypothetical protein